MSSNRRFEVQTPLGKLLVYAKRDSDAPQDYPGVYIDFVQTGGSELIELACVEYESAKKLIQTCVFEDGLLEAPSHIVEHFNLLLEENPNE